MDRVRVDLGARGYDVCVGRGLLARAGELISPLVAPSRAGLVFDEGVPTAHVLAVEAGLRAAGFDPARASFPAGEAHKTFGTVERLCDALSLAGLDRGSPIVAVGGGVATDLGGFVASVLYRGVPWVAMPTTLLAQVDAAVGGKTGVDLPSGKNLAGAFWQPRLVVCDVETLVTLPSRDLRAGLAEVLKCAVMADASLADRLDALAGRLLAADPEALAEAVRRAVAVKAAVVAADEREASGARRLLNFGHTVGHALEAGSGYALRHGEAVALGMIAAARVSRRVGACGPEVEAWLCERLARLGLPTDLDGRLGATSLETLVRDKKRAGAIVEFVCVEAPGRVRVAAVPAGEIPEMLRG